MCNIVCTRETTLLAKMNKQKTFFLHTCCLCIRTYWFTHLLSHISQQFTDRKPVYTAVSVYQSTIHTQKPVYTSVAMCWQLLDRKPVYTVAVYRLAIHRQKTSLHSCCHVLISNSPTENQFTHLLLCISQQLTDRNQFKHLLHASVSRQKTSLHICCSQSVRNLQ